MTRHRLILSLTLLVAPPLAGADDAVTATQQGAADPSAIRALQAIVMDVRGKARWRPSADAEWRDAKVNDIVEPGTEVKTGLRSRLTMRVGRNATVLVDSGTTFEMPEVIEENGQLRTTAAVRSGRVDFKVDKLDGFANDFKVITPQTTLAVRGTGFSLATGPLQGFEVTGARTNMVNAIELNYVAQNLNYFVSGDGKSSSERQDPVQNAWVSTVGPPPIVGALVNNQQLVQQVAQGTAGNAPTNPQQFQQIAAAEANGQAGNTLVVAANEPDASGAMRDLAIDATGREDAVPDTGGGGGSTDVADYLPAGPLRDSLLFARGASGDAIDDAAAVSSRATAVNAPADALEARLGNPAVESQLVSLMGGGAAATAMLEEALDAGEVPILVQPGTSPVVLNEIQGSGMPGALAGRVTAFENRTGASIFTSAPTTEGGGDPGFGTGQGNFGNSFMVQGSANGTGIVRALENAQAWSDRDLTFSEAGVDGVRQLLPDGGGGSLNASEEQQVQVAVTLLYGLANRWSLDGARSNGESATQLAMALNEHLQGAWDGVALSTLGNSPLRDIATTQQALTEAISSLRGQLDLKKVSDVHSGAGDFGRAYAALANQAGSSAATTASVEVAGLVLDAQIAALNALEDAVVAYENASRARTLGHRVFFQRAGNLVVRAAADYALRAQEATDTIVSNALAMTRNYDTVHASAGGAGVLPAGFDQGLGSDLNPSGTGHGNGNGNGNGGNQ